ncbi:MAG: sulfatase [Bacteroides sp.]
MKKQSIPLLTYTVLLPAATLSAQSSTPTPPNLVFIMADQYRGDALGCLKKEPVQTPCLDQLAAEGVNFTNAISSYPVSSPARAMLMTGMYPMANKVTGNCNSMTAPYGVELPQDARCWSNVLKENGYHTGYIGKWHLDAPHKPYVDTYNNHGKIAWNEWCPPERRHGFDHWIAYGTYDYHLKPMYWNTEATRDSFYYVNQWGPAYEASKAIEFINQQQKEKQPFALVVSMNPPHTGYELVPDRYKEIYKELDVEALCADRPDIPKKGTPMGDYFRKNIRNYYACITGVDENVGRIVQALKQNGLSDNTLVVFTSDHGICMGAHGHDGKDVFYEEAMRIPMIVSWPKKIKPRKDDKLMIGFADLGPSLLSLMGFQHQIPKTVQTFDLSKEIVTGKGKKDLTQPYYFIQVDQPTTGYRGLRTSTHTYAVHATDGKVDHVVLFDRQKDPFQKDNIANKQPKLTRAFSQQLKTWLTQTDDPFANYLIP